MYVPTPPRSHMSSQGLPEVDVFPDHAFALAQPRGRIDGDLLEAYGRAMAFDPRWRPGFTEVWDTSLCQDVDVLPSDITRMKALEEETVDLLRGSTTLIIVDRPLIRITVDLYATIMKRFGREIAAVQTQADAASWLGIDRFPVLT